MKLAPIAAVAVAGSLALGFGGVALAAGGDAGPADSSGADSSSTSGADLDAEFEAFDQCLRDQGVDLPELPDLPEGDEELTDEQIAELDAVENIEISDEAWEACESLLPDDGAFGDFDDEAFAEFDKCLTDAGVPIGEFEEGPEGETEGDEPNGDEGDEAAEGAEPSEAEIAEFDAAFEKCEELLPEGALLEGCDEPGHEGDQPDSGDDQSEDTESGDADDGSEGRDEGESDEGDEPESDDTGSDDEESDDQA